MANVFMIVEGATEENFYGKTLQQYYIGADGNYRCYFQVVQMPSLRNAASRINKGGAVSFDLSVRQVKRFIHQASHADLVVLVYDYYGLHSSFTDHLQGTALPLANRVKSIVGRFEHEIDNLKFRFYLQIHEFESLLFSELQVTADHFAAPNTLPILQSILAEAGGDPELINNHPETAPSKRLGRLYTGYGKVTDGIALAGKIGVERMRTECSYFDGFCRLIDGILN